MIEVSGFFSCVLSSPFHPTLLTSTSTAVAPSTTLTSSLPLSHHHARTGEQMWKVILHFHKYSSQDKKGTHTVLLITKEPAQNAISRTFQDFLQEIIGMSYVEAFMMKLEAELPTITEPGEDLPVITDGLHYTMQEIADIIAADPPYPMN